VTSHTTRSLPLLGSVVECFTCFYPNCTTTRVNQFLKNVHLDYRHTYSFWRNQVKPWFAKIGRDVTTAQIESPAFPLLQSISRLLKNKHDPGKPHEAARNGRLKSSHFV
jgi:hypothetical protein